MSFYRAELHCHSTGAQHMSQSQQMSSTRDKSSAAVDGHLFVDDFLGLAQVLQGLQLAGPVGFSQGGGVAALLDLGQSSRVVPFFDPGAEGGDNANSDVSRSIHARHSLMHCFVIWW